MKELRGRSVETRKEVLSRPLYAGHVHKPKTISFEKGWRLGDKVRMLQRHDPQTIKTKKQMIDEGTFDEWLDN